LSNEKQNKLGIDACLTNNLQTQIRKITLPGLSSHPPTNLPSMTQLAPAHIALHIFPENLLPPSEIRGTCLSLQIY